MEILSGIVVFTLIFEHFLNVPVTHDGVALSLPLLGFAFGVYVFKALAEKDERLFLIPVSRAVHMFVIVFLAVMVVSLINSRNLSVSLDQLQRFSYCVLIYFFIVFVVRRLSHFNRVWKYMLAAYVISALLGLVEAYTGVDIYNLMGGKSFLGAPVSENVLMMSDPGRIHGPLGDPEFHSGRMIVLFFISLPVLLTATSRWKKFFALGMVLLATANILGAAFKGAIPALMIGLAVFLVPLKNRWKWPLMIGSPIVIVCAGLLVGLIFPKVPVGRLVGIGGGYEDRIKFRKNNVLIAIEMGMDHPIIGNGPNGFFIRYGDYARWIPGARSWGIKAHNTYAQVFAEFGLVGLAVFVFVLGWTLFQVGRFARKVDGKSRYLCLALLASISAHLVLMAGSNFLVDQNLWLLLGLSWSLLSALEDQSFRGEVENGNSKGAAGCFESSSVPGGQSFVPAGAYRA